jgi:tripartite-type tricarboxylate transporter receptor subunit TctC
MKASLIVKNGFRFYLLACALVSLAFMSGFAQAQSSDKAIKILVGFPPGGSADVIARMVAQRMEGSLGQTIIVENKPGAAGRIAIEALKAAAPDGNTLIVMPSGPVVIFPHVFKKLNYDPVKDLTPVSQLAGFQFAVVSGPKTNVKNIAEMLAKAKTDPSGNTYASSGNGTVPHFLGVMLGDAAKIDFQHIPFQGGAPALNALLGGHVGYNMDVVSEALEAHKAGKARVIAVTGVKRSGQLPEVPTLREQGIAMDASAWFAMYGPAKMPAAVLAKINQAVVAAIKDASVQERLISQGYEPIGSSPEQLAAVQKADFAKWEKPVKASGFQAD